MKEKRTQRIQQVLSKLALIGNNLSTRASDIRVEIKRLPEMVNTRWAGSGSYVEEDTDVGFEDATEGVEEPSVDITSVEVLRWEGDEGKREGETYR